MKANNIFDSGSIEVGLTLFSFKENNVTFIYSPAIDITGYGKNVKEAKLSFELALEEFVRFAIEKGTLQKHLEKMGWKIAKDKDHIEIEQPTIDNLINNNNFLLNLVQEKDFRKYSKNYNLTADA